MNTFPDRYRLIINNKNVSEVPLWLESQRLVSLALYRHPFLYTLFVCCGGPPQTKNVVKKKNFPRTYHLSPDLPLTLEFAKRGSGGASEWNQTRNGRPFGGGQMVGPHECALHLRQRAVGRHLEAAHLMFIENSKTNPGRGDGNDCGLLNQLNQNQWPLWQWHISSIYR
jgi:hypothetical protein